MYKLTSLLLLICTASVSIIAGQSYELKLGREIRPADSYVLSGYSQRIARVRIKEASGNLYEVQNDTVTVRIKAVCEINAVTTDGQEAIKYVKIELADVTRRGKLKELIPPGTSLKASFSDSGTVITKDDVPIDPDILADLVAVIRSEGGRKTSEIMDAAKKVKVKQKWQMNKKAFRNSLDPVAQKTVKDLKGQVSFDRIDSTISTRPVAVVSLKASAKDAIGEMQGTPTSSSSMIANVTLSVPLDTRYPATHVASTTQMFATFGKGEGSAVVELTISDDLNFQR